MAGSVLRPLLLFGPSGSGKSTLIKLIFKEFPDKFGYSVSHTTRKPRTGEVDGVHYHFTDVETMKKSITDGKFIETVTFGGNLYGTSKEAVALVQKQGKVCVLDIDIQGVRLIRKTNLNPWCVFLRPPSLEVLEKRLRARCTETEDSIQQRLKAAVEEIKYGSEPGNFDIVIVNEDLEHTFQQLKDFILKNVLVHSNGVQH